VSAVDGDRIAFDRAVGERFRFGEACVLDGASGGWRSRVMVVNGDAVLLRDVPPFDILAGCRVRLTEGCDKRFATCRDRFANGLNFRGEPHLPGMDLLTRYPGA